ncbi:Target SNARE coiled-coil domain-containing protein [Cynara cardunculus var. scolymus]|uniref:Target SNARE coiled-coil domain-containing protein n=1 Tax=Cynara cardunculus var. scolymus TaxID=59895 RepID=A0A103XX32_CYNCS|nr:Target SNARE coiled-coil domain-containing protein [Cynara cardunculus var. scolymus]
MFGIKKPHFHLHRTGKNNSVDPSHHAPNPFDSDDEFDKKSTLNQTRRTSSEPALLVPDSRASLFDDDEVKGTSGSSGYKLSYASRNKYKNDFVDSGGIENQDVQELEEYAAYKAEETTKTVNSALKIAENIREDATKTMITLHQQDDPALRKGAHLEQREKLGLTTTPTKGQRHSKTPPSEPTNAMQKVEYEKSQQDDALSDLSNILGELKEMAVDMGSEIERQNKALDPLQDDVDELNFRVRGANQRTRRLLGK